MAAKKKKKRKKQEWWAQQQQNKRKRQQQREEKKRLLAMEDDKGRADEERWHEMSCVFVEEESMKKAVAWREGRQCLSAWRAVNHWRVMSGEWWVEPEMKEAEEPAENAAGVETAEIEIGGWCESGNDQLTQSSVERSGEDELDWMEVQAAIKMMQGGTNRVAKEAAVVEENPLFAAVVGAEVAAESMAASVSAVVAGGAKKL